MLEVAHQTLHSLHVCSCEFTSLVTISQWLLFVGRAVAFMALLATALPPFITQVLLAALTLYCMTMDWLSGVSLQSWPRAPRPRTSCQCIALLISAPPRLCAVCTQLMMFGIHWNCLHVAQASTWLSQWPHAALVSSIVTASCVVGDQALQRCFPARQGALFLFSLAWNQCQHSYTHVH